MKIITPKLRQKKNALLPFFLRKVFLIITFTFFTITSFSQISGNTRGYSERHAENLIGNFKMIGNQNLACISGCPGTPVTNNGVNMVYGDIDTDVNTVNSSMANLDLPAGAKVTWAGLYWGGVYSSSRSGINAFPAGLNIDQVKFKKDGAANYTNINATVRNVDNTQSNWSVFMAHADVTSIIQTEGAGDYYLADLALVTGRGFTGPNGGWTLIVIYELDGEKSRRINVWDGFRFFGFGGTDSFTVTGLDTPNTGAFETHVGYFGMDGEANQTGDFVRINGNSLGNTLNPTNNTLNGTISTFGVNNANRNPNLDYNWAIDIDVFDSSGNVPNNATSANVQLGSTSEGLWGGVFVISNEIAIPSIKKTISPETITLGASSKVTLEIKNPSGGVTLTGVSITDQLPSGMVVAATPNATSPCGGTISATAGATSVTFSGVSIAPGATCLFTFDVTTNAIGTYVNNVPNTSTDFTNDQSLDLINQGEDNLIVVNKITAVDDDFRSNVIISTLGGTAGDVTTNDTINGAAFNDTDVTISITNNGGLTQATIDANGNINVSNGATEGSYTVTYQICESATSQCDTATALIRISNDTDGDGVADINDLDDDNDGILDDDEAYCNLPAVANSTSGNGAFQNQLYFFNWTGSDFTDGIQNGDSQTFNLPDGLTITATFSNVSNAANASTYLPSDMQTWGGALIHNLYNTAGTAEALYGADGADVSFTVTFVATKNSLSYPLNLLAIDPESTNTNEDLIFSTNGGNWKLLEQYNGGGIWTGVGTSTLEATDTEPSGGNSIFYSENASVLDITINPGGREAIAFGIRLICDTDNDGIPNYLDTDSDNDGCPDAIEGAGTFSLAQANNSLTGGSVGGSLLNFGTTVNTNGIPTIVTGGATTGTETTGQATSTAVTDNSDKTACDADLSVTKTVDKVVPKKGGTIVFTITLKNVGPQQATGVQVKDLLPTGLTYNAGASTIPANTTYTAGTGIWDLSAITIAKDQTIELKIAATVNTTGAIITNKAEVFSATESDSDSTPNNNN